MSFQARPVKPKKAQKGIHNTFIENKKNK